MLKFDLGMMFAAIETRNDGPQYTGFLNRNTGEIIFVYEDEGEATIPFKEAIADRRRREASPGEWLEIPKYHGRSDDYGHEEFIDSFLREHGLR